MKTLAKACAIVMALSLGMEAQAQFWFFRTPGRIFPRFGSRPGPHTAEMIRSAQEIVGRHQKNIEKWTSEVQKLDKEVGQIQQAAKSQRRPPTQEELVQMGNRWREMGKRNEEIKEAKEHVRHLKENIKKWTRQGSALDA